MRAAVMRAGKLVVDTVPDPAPGPGQVLVRTLACGICGSDLHALRFADRVVDMARRTGMPMHLDPTRDLVLGHEFSAEIVDYGPDTQRTLPAGTRVCALPIVISPDAVDTVGYSNLHPGGYGERMVVMESALFPLPDGLSAEHAALTEPLAVGMHAVAKARLAGEEVPLVVGCGPVGLAVIAALRHRGAGPIVAADFSPARRALAERLGADVVVDPAAVSPYRRWEEVATPPGVDPRTPLAMLGLAPGARPCVVFECVGVPGVIAQILEHAPRATRVVVAGACMERDTLEPFFGVVKEIELGFVYGWTPAEFAEALQAIASGAIDVSPLITGTVGVGGVARAFEELGTPERHAKILVQPWRE